MFSTVRYKHTNTFASYDEQRMRMLRQSCDEEGKSAYQLYAHTDRYLTYLVCVCVYSKYAFIKYTYKPNNKVFFFMSSILFAFNVFLFPGWTFFLCIRYSFCFFGVFEYFMRLWVELGNIFKLFMTLSILY